jgi:hypothetical protein
MYYVMILQLGGCRLRVQDIFFISGTGREGSKRERERDKALGVALQMIENCLASAGCRQQLSPQIGNPLEKRARAANRSERFLLTIVVAARGFGTMAVSDVDPLRKGEHRIPRCQSCLHLPNFARLWKVRTTEMLSCPASGQA